MFRMNGKIPNTKNRSSLARDVKRAARRIAITGIVLTHGLESELIIPFPNTPNLDNEIVVES